MVDQGSIPLIGAWFFGAIVGWIAYGIYRSAKELTVQWLAAIIGVVAGGAVTAVFKDQTLFGAYCIGLGLAFFLRVFGSPWSTSSGARRSSGKWSGKSREPVTRTSYVVYASDSVRRSRQRSAGRHRPSIHDGPELLPAQ